MITNEARRLKYQRDPAQSRANSKRYRDANREKLASSKRSAYYSRMYGLSIPDLDSLLVRQGGECAICRTGSPGGVWGSFHVDHNHTTGEVRGLLCCNCNRGLGLFQDNPHHLQSAIAYLTQGVEHAPHP